MTAALWAARAVLAAVFTMAAFGKFLDRPGATKAAEGLGVPAAAARPVATALPVMETGAAVLLIVPATSRVGAAIALALLGAFSVAVAGALRGGRRPACHCFGARSAHPVGPDALVRNAALALLAVVVLIGPS